MGLKKNRLAVLIIILVIGILSLFVNDFVIGKTAVQSMRTSDSSPMKPVHISYQQGYNSEYLKYAFSPDGSPLDLQIIENNANNSRFGYNSIAVDAITNKPHVIYIDELSGNLKYAKYVGINGNCGFDSNGNLIGNWQCGLLEDPFYPVNVNVPPSIDIQYSYIPDTLHAIYMSSLLVYPYTSRLIYAEYVANGGNCGPNGYTWRCRTVDENIGSISLATNYLTGKAHISYHKGGGSPDGSMNYASYVGFYNGNCGYLSSWQCDVIENGVEMSSIGVGNSVNEVPQISYNKFNSTNGYHNELKYAKYVGGGGNCGPSGNPQVLRWQCDVIDDFNGGMSSLSVEDNGRPHISYLDDQNMDLKYARYVGSGGNCGPSGDWQCDVIDKKGNVGTFSSINVIDGIAHISYFDTTNLRLKLARYVGSGGNCGPQNEWSCQFVDDPGFFGQSSTG